MKLRYKILIAIALISAIFFAYDFLVNPPLKSASNTSLEGFICSNETKTLTIQEKEQREQRETELRKALSDTIGIRMEGHGIKLHGIGPKIKRVYEMQTKLSIEDWDILSEVFVKDYERWWLEHNDRREAIIKLFAIQNKEAISILKCKINNMNIAQSEKSDLEHAVELYILGLTGSPGFILSYEKYKKD
ncbi:MAG: hypothetical protein LBL65_07955 [Campylobacteraceae bacterium]|jgi:hypothetical protein|nr:hypothetical protein [Campylobacteraceae bacterium]